MIFKKGGVHTKLDSYVLFLSLGRYIWWWTISPRVYHPPSSQWYGTDIVYLFDMTYHRVSNKSNMTGAICTAGTSIPSGAHEFTPVFSGVRIARSLALCVMYCRSFFVLLSFFFLWSLYGLSFFDLRLLITPLVSSNLNFLDIFAIEIYSF